MTSHQVIKKSFSEAAQALRVLPSGAASGDEHDLDEEQIWRRVYDAATQSIRTVDV